MNVIITELNIFISNLNSPFDTQSYLLISLLNHKVKKAVTNLPLVAEVLMSKYMQKWPHFPKSCSFGLVAVFLMFASSQFCGEHLLSTYLKCICFIKFFFSWNGFLIGWSPKIYLLFFSSVLVFFFRFQSNILNCTLNTIELSSGKRHKSGVGQIPVFFKKHIHISHRKTRFTKWNASKYCMLDIDSITTNCVLKFVTQRKSLLENPFSSPPKCLNLIK